LAALKWRDLLTRDDARQVTVFGNGPILQLRRAVASTFGWVPRRTRSCGNTLLPGAMYR
jgi:hypothetical protein